MVAQKKVRTEIPRPKRKRKARASSPPVTRSKCINRKTCIDRDCGICLQPVTERGLIQGCDHVFCFSCLKTWVDRSSTCPHCKREVKMIVKSDIDGKKIKSKHRIVRKNLRDTLEEEEYEQRRRVLGSVDSSTRSSFLISPIQNHIAAAQQLLRENAIRMSSFGSTLFDSVASGTPVGSNPLFSSMQNSFMPFNMDIYNNSLANMRMDINFFLNQQLASAAVNMQLPLQNQQSLFSTQQFNFPPQVTYSSYSLPQPQQFLNFGFQDAALYGENSLHSQIPSTNLSGTRNRDLDERTQERPWTSEP